MSKYEKRPSPPVSATQFSEGTIKKGNDGNQWIIKRIGNSNRWVKFKQEKQPKQSTAKQPKQSTAKQPKQLTAKQPKQTKSKSVSLFTKIKNCITGKIVNPETGKCVKKSGRIGKKLMKK